MELLMKTHWSADRIKRLFLRYDDKYWKRKLRRYSISEKNLGRYWGKCDPQSKSIWIDIEAHPSDVTIRSTLLHEMCHAAAGVGKVSHGYNFWAQVEKLLRLGAPIALHCPETGGHQILKGVVPARFPLSRKAMDRIGEKRSRLEYKIDGTFDIQDHVSLRCEDFAALAWRDAKLIIGAEIGLTDVQGRPRNREAERILEI